LALSSCLWAGSAANAATVIFDSGRMDTPRIVTIEGIGKVYATPMQFTGTYDGTAFTDLVAFCVDVYHRITRADYNPDLVYTDELSLTTDSNPAGPTLLTSGQITQIGQLANYGTLTFYNASTGTAAQQRARFNELAAIQGAIWQVASGLNVTSTNAGIDARIDAYSGAGYASLFNASYGAVSSAITFLAPVGYPSMNGTQAFVIPDTTGGGVGVVPEPAAWALMIGGFAIMGGVLRRRRALLPA
jgi:hypothetical protein